MSFIFQLFLLGFVLYSLLMVIAVPVLYSNAGDWGQSKRIILLGSAVWAGYVLVLGALNFLI